MNITQNEAVCFKHKACEKQRLSNLELLRILAALFVIILHYNNNSLGQAFAYTHNMKIHYAILLFFEMISICAVNIFVMISGYFLCTTKQVKVWKVLRLYVDVIVLSVLHYCLECCMGDAVFSLRELLVSFIPHKWYVAVYSGLYLLFPFLNSIVQGRTRTQFRFMLLVFFFVLSLWPYGIQVLGSLLGFSYTSLNPISIHGHGDGYTLIHFIFLYFLGAYFRTFESELISTKKRNCAILVFGGCSVIGTILGSISLSYALPYCSPLVIIQTVAIFTIFQNIQIYSKTINSIASCAFGVYLFHPFFYRFCGIQHFVTGNPLVIPIHIVLCALIIYAASAAIYWIYQKAFHPVFRLLQNKLDFLSYSADGPL